MGTVWAGKVTGELRARWPEERASVPARLGQALDGLAFSLLLVAVVLVPLAQADASLGLLLLRVGLFSSLTLWLLGASLTGRLPLASPLLVLPLAAYLALVAASLALSPYFHGSAQAALTTAACAAGFFVAAGTAGKEARRRLLLLAFCLSGLALSAYGLAQFLGYGWTAMSAEGRVSSVFFNPNRFAGVLDLILPLVLGLLLYSGKLWLRLALLPLALLLAFNLGLTYSRGGWVAVTATTLLLALVWAGRGRTLRASLRRVTVLLLVVATVALMAVTFIQSSPRLRGDLSERALQLVNVQDNASFLARVTVARASLPLVADHPWFGVGPGNFAHAFVSYRPPQVSDRVEDLLHRTLTHALNDALQVASETGLPSLLAFALFWTGVLVLRPAFTRAAFMRAGAVAGLAALMLHGLVDGNLTVAPASAFLAYVLAGLLHAPPP